MLLPLLPSHGRAQIQPVFISEAVSLVCLMVALPSVCLSSSTVITDIFTKSSWSRLSLHRSGGSTHVPAFPQPLCCVGLLLLHRSVKSLLAWHLSLKPFLIAWGKAFCASITSQTYLHTCMHACIYSYMRAYLCTYMHTYIRVCVYIYIRIYMHTQHLACRNHSPLFILLSLPPGDKFFQVRTVSYSSLQYQRQPRCQDNGCQ